MLNRPLVIRRERREVLDIVRAGGRVHFLHCHITSRDIQPVNQFVEWGGDTVSEGDTLTVWHQSEVVLCLKHRAQVEWQLLQSPGFNRKICCRCFHWAVLFRGWVGLFRVFYRGDVCRCFLRTFHSRPVGSAPIAPTVSLLPATDRNDETGRNSIDRARKNKRYGHLIWHDKVRVYRIKPDVQNNNKSEITNISIYLICSFVPLSTFVLCDLLFRPVLCGAIPSSNFRTFSTHRPIKMLGFCMNSKFSEKSWRHIEPMEPI